MNEEKVLTRKEAERLMRLFMDDHTVKEMKDFINTHLVSKKDWRKSFIHFDIYNRINHNKGYLSKLDAIRRDISCTSAKEVVEILYIMGYGIKRIIYLVFEFGFEGINHHVVRSHLRYAKTHLNAERQKFMNLIETAKTEVFQKLHQEVFDAEAKSVRLYLDQVAAIQCEIEKLMEPELGGYERNNIKLRRLRKDLEEIEDRLKKVHGIDDIRKAMIDVAAERQKIAARLGKNQLGDEGLDAIPERPCIVQKTD